MIPVDMSNYLEEKLSDDAVIRTRIADLSIGQSVADDPRVSVIIPAYGVAPYVRETLESVFAQTFGPFEVIVINDGSPDSDELERQVEPFRDRIVYGRQENLGASQARNSAICLSRAPIVAFLDGDDIWEPNFLESQIAFMESNKLDMVYCDAHLFGQELFEGDLFSRTSPSSGAVTTESLISATCNVITSGTVLRRSALEKTNLFDVELPRMQDFDLWYRVAKHGFRIGYQTLPLVRYRVRLDSLSGSPVDRCLRNIKGLNVIHEKYGLNESETRAFDRTMHIYTAEYELEMGKYSLTRGDYHEALEHVRSANRHFRRFKLIMLIALLRISPSIALRLFQRLRPAEYSFIAAEKS